MGLGPILLKISINTLCLDVPPCKFPIVISVTFFSRFYLKVHYVCTVFVFSSSFGLIDQQFFNYITNSLRVGEPHLSLITYYFGNRIHFVIVFSNSLIHSLYMCPSSHGSESFIISNF